MERPVYFVSSNTHSITNLLTGFALTHQDELVQFLGLKENADLLVEWKAIREQNVPSSRENFLYYVLKKFQGTEKGQYLLEMQIECERAYGITRNYQRVGLRRGSPGD